jgi:putative phosphoesterase
VLIAILSDTHSRAATIVTALAQIDKLDAELLIHCGDIEDTDVIDLFPPHTHFVFGNCDADRRGMRAAIAARGATLHEPFGHLEIDGLHLGFLHGDDQAQMRDLFQSDAFQFIFHGHTHQIRDERIGAARVINPGALHRARVKTFALLDTQSQEVKWVEVE